MPDNAEFSLNPLMIKSILLEYFQNTYSLTSRSGLDGVAAPPTLLGI